MQKIITHNKQDIESEYLKGSSLRYSETKNKDIIEYINEEVQLSIPHKEKVYCYINDIVPKCKNPECGSLRYPKFQNFKLGYKDFCSVSCAVSYSKNEQEKTRIQNIQKKTSTLTIEEIVQKLYTKELKIQKWREINKLKDYINFGTLEQLYKHLVLKENQICEYCNTPFDVDRQTKETRKCSCTTMHERNFFEIQSIKSSREFVLKAVGYKFHEKLNGAYNLFIEELYKRIDKKTDNHIENIYCFLNNEEVQNEDFVNLSLGYKKRLKIIDYTKDTNTILKDIMAKYGDNYKRSLEFMYWINHFNGLTLKECLQNLNSGYIKEFRSFEGILSAKDVTRELLSKKDLVKIKDKEYKCLKCKNNFVWDYTSNPICRECNPKITGYSLQEKKVLSFVESVYSGEAVPNDRSFGVEFDIYLPELKIAIEYNGLYWHSSRFKDKKYHLKKTEIAESNDIQLIHIFENEWLQKQEIVKSILKAKLQKTENIIYARKCKIEEVSSKISNKFLEDNHIQGKDNAPIRYGLFYEGKLVQLMTLKRSHRSKEKYMELKRSCSILNTNIVGGFSKLLKYIKGVIKEDIITFADRRYSYKNNIYSKYGVLQGKIPCNHFWIQGLELKGREGFQKHKLKDILETFDSSKTAIENCHNNNLYEIYDCGNWKYTL